MLYFVFVSFTSGSQTLQVYQAFMLYTSLTILVKIKPAITTMLTIHQSSYVKPNAAS